MLDTGQGCRKETAVGDVLSVPFPRVCVFDGIVARAVLLFIENKDRPGAGPEGTVPRCRTCGVQGLMRTSPVSRSK
jgi:hypothetical protein